MPPGDITASMPLSLTPDQQRHVETWVAGRWRYCPHCLDRRPRWSVSGPYEIPPSLAVIAVTCGGCAATTLLEADRLGLPL